MTNRDSYISDIDRRTMGTGFIHETMKGYTRLWGFYQTV
jgi:hypothetical protein